MTLNGKIALILRYFTEFCSFRCTRRKSILFVYCYYHLWWI